MRFACFAFLLVFLSACGSDTVVQDMKRFDDYPSASAIDYFHQRFYVMGDDATYLLILDSSLNRIDSIHLYHTPSPRIDKAQKADLEAMTFLSNGKLLLIGSGSVEPQRNAGWIVDPVNKKADSIRLDTFYHRLYFNKIVERNIEGIVQIPGMMILMNRGNKHYRYNQLIFTRDDFWQQQTNTFLHTALVGFNRDSSSFGGVSGGAFAPKNDRLLLTVSTENTNDALHDGAIGKSYLWIIKNISTKTRWSAINPDEVIDLGAIDKRLQNQKIESVCVVSESKKFLYLALAADNDNGRSVIFRLAVPVH